ncbi:MAG: c-type cytochrome [Chitinophagaceae bacterium]|nr:c-type cytochrome [Chitinophagaceae bacterium]
MPKKYRLGLIILISVIYACNKDIIAEKFAGFKNPANFPQPVYHFSTNEITQSKFELGRKLFYDPILSRNNTISCGSCHIQTSAFSHHGHNVSHGIDDKLGTRNAPAIMNLAWYTSFMWDGGVFDLDLQPVAPLTNHVEMDETMENALKKLKASADYPSLFNKAFGEQEITTAAVLKALSQFMLMCVSSNSKYDSVMRGEGKTFSTEEEKGYKLFQEKCSSCHKEPLFTDNSFRNNGLAPTSIDDKGRQLVTLNEQDAYTFKVPSLRNLSYTAPYMHDGRFYTLEAVLEYYNSKVQQSPTLDPLLKKETVSGIRLTDEEKNYLLAFLKTLDDTSFLKDKKLSEQ